MKKLTLSIAALGLALLAVASAGAQPYKYVALGDSLTAGWQSGCLVQRNQVNSYPAVLARVFGITDFQQPLVQEVPISNPPGTECRGAIFDTATNSITVGFVSQMGSPLNLLLDRPYDNLGLPGAEVKDLTQLTHGDPFGTDLEKIAALVLRNVTGFPLDGTNAVQQADILLGSSTATNIVTLWIGNNDVLGASTSGIVVDGVTLTTVADFTASYHAILASLLPSDIFVAANIPDVTSIPFSSTIPPVVVDPSTRQPVLVGGAPVSLLGPGDDAFPCTPTPPNAGCDLPAGTLVNLTASPLLAAGVGIPVQLGGTGAPLPVGFIDGTGAHAGVLLYPDTVDLLQTRVGEYNQVISEQVLGGTVIDVNSLFRDIKANGYPIGGITLKTDFLTGGIFGYDGVHPSTIGYTVVADVFVQQMNAGAGTSFSRPNFSDVLFTPNLPQPTTVAQSGGLWDYSMSTWAALLAQFNPLRGATIQLPRVPRTVRPVEPRSTSAGATRAIARPELHD